MKSLKNSFKYDNTDECLQITNISHLNDLIFEVYSILGLTSCIKFKLIFFRVYSIFKFSCIELKFK